MNTPTSAPLREVSSEATGVAHTSRAAASLVMMLVAAVWGAEKGASRSVVVHMWQQHQQQQLQRYASQY